MKTILLMAALAFLAPAAHADTPVFVALSSVTSCHIAVSTSAPSRVDNFGGSCSGLMEGRNVVRVINGAGTLHVGFSVKLSTQEYSGGLLNPWYGDTINPSDKVEYALGTRVTLYLMSETAGSAPRVTIQQAK
jgi:hypothetical protein